MNEPKPLACSLGAADLRQRLEDIATLGADSLIGHEETKQGHLLRFRSDDRTRQRLKQIVAAESECCPFLDLQLSEHDDELLLSLGANDEGRPVADELASTFSATR